MAKIVGIFLSLCGFAHNNRQQHVNLAPKRRKVSVKDQPVKSVQCSRNVLDLSSVSSITFVRQEKLDLTTESYISQAIAGVDKGGQNDVVPDAVGYQVPCDAKNESHHDRMNGMEKRLQEVSETQKKLRKEVEKQLREMIQTQRNLREEMDLITKAEIKKTQGNRREMRKEISETSDSD